jgi:hypothetical protein
VADTNGLAFFATAKGPKAPAVVGGELTLADLTKTDLTGDLLWLKLPQPAGSKGLDLTGRNTILRANGCVYPGTLNFAGSAAVTLYGGGVAVESGGGPLTNGVPPVPSGSLKSWKVTSTKTGQFTFTVAVPGITKPVTGKGLYLPKSGIAFGFFPGKTIGGRVVLELP